MQVLVLGGTLPGIRAAETAARLGHTVTLCTPHYALGEDVVGSWAAHTRRGLADWQEPLAFLGLPDTPTPLQIKHALDTRLSKLGVKVLYASRPAAIAVCGQAACGAAVEGESGLRYFPADLVLDAGAYGEYIAATSAQGRIMPAGARLTVRVDYRHAGGGTCAPDVQTLEGTMEEGHMQLLRHVTLHEPATLSVLRRMALRETARLCREQAEHGWLGEAAELYPAFPNTPEVTGFARPASRLPGLMYAAEWLRDRRTFAAKPGVESLACHGSMVPCACREGRLFPDLAALPGKEAQVAVAGGGTAGCCAAIGAAETGADVLLLERGALLGGTRTAGGMLGLYYGNRSDVFRRFFGRWNEDAAKLRQRRNSATEALSVAAMAEEAGVRWQVCTALCGAQAQDGRVRRLLVAGEDGLYRISAAQFVDATGTGEVAASCGCAMRFGDAQRGWTQNYSQWRICDSAHAAYQRVDQGVLNHASREALTEEVRRCLADDCAYDLTDMLTPREGRRLLGRISVTLADVMRGAGFPDTLCHAFSTYDPHGRSFHPAGRLGLLPAQDTPRYAPVPLRAMLPREVDNLLVCGKALSMEQDALNYARMAPDVMVAGYLAGRVAGACIGAHCDPDALSLAPLQDEMRERHALMEVPRVTAADMALRIACGEEAGFAQAVLTDDAAVLPLLDDMEKAGALSALLPVDKTRLWFGDTRGAARCTEKLNCLAESLRDYVYIDRQGKAGVVRAGLVGPIDDYWQALQLAALLARAGYRAACPALVRLLQDTHVEDQWTNSDSAYASIRLDTHTPASYDRTLTLASACAWMPFAAAAPELRRLAEETARGHAEADHPWQRYLLECLTQAAERCETAG